MEAVPSGISIRRGCELLGLNRSTLYYEEKPADIDDVDLLNTIRDIWEKELRENYRLAVNRKRVQRLMALGGIKAIHPGPNTSKRNKQHAIHPYLLKDTPITRPCFTRTRESYQNQADY
jgi:putative transposase